MSLIAHGLYASRERSPHQTRPQIYLDLALSVTFATSIMFEQMPQYNKLRQVEERGLEGVFVFLDVSPQMWKPLQRGWRREAR